MILIHPNDNILVSPTDGQKYARRAIEAGERIVKYGYPIGVATEAIKKDEMVHSHNMKTRLSGIGQFHFHGTVEQKPPSRSGSFLGYPRPDGTVGVRNEIWILPTVGCVNGTAKRLAELTGAKAYTHPWGCSQLGGDLLTTQRTLAGLAKNPNAAGVLIIGLGCENNTMESFRRVLGDVDPRRFRFLVTQQESDEIEQGLRLLAELAEYRDSVKRTPCPISSLRIGLKCGGSDGYSGLTANPLVGRIADRICEYGGSALLTEVPEMFGGEEVLLDRCVSREVYDRAVSMMQGFRDYFTSHGEGVSENPSPGNVEGGITTLEEKSLGCVQKGGAVPVTDVLTVGEQIRCGGLSLVSGPGNDIVATTTLAASGAQMILFTTGRGTPLGGPVPTVKIATNNRLAKHKPLWIDYNAGALAEGASFDDEADELFALLLRIAEGKETRSELNQTQEISIFKDGVIL